MKSSQLFVFPEKLTFSGCNTGLKTLNNCASGDSLCNSITEKFTKYENSVFTVSFSIEIDNELFPYLQYIDCT